MKLVKANNEGIFTFTTADLTRDVIFVKSQATAANLEDAHCSNHAYYANGCSDCEAIAFVKTFSPDRFEKLPLRRLTKGNFISPLEIQIAKPNPKTQLLRQQLSRVLAVFFAKEKNKAAVAAAKKYQEINKITTKEKQVIIAYAAWQAIEWENLISAVETDLLAAAQMGAQAGMMQLGIVDSTIEANINEALKDYAGNRSAGMIGKRFIGTKLVEDPSSKMVIAETTKDDLEDLIGIVLEEEESIEQMKARINAAATFSDARAQFISTTEIAMAQVAGHLAVWRLSKKVTKVGIRLSPEHDVEDECDELASASPYSISNVPLIPSHPNCACTIFVWEE